MLRYFLDTSALVKRYHREQGTSEVEKLFETSGNRLFISRLAFVELQSAFSRLVRSNELPAVDYDDIRLRLRDDVASGLMVVTAVSSRRLAEAADLLGTVGLTLPLRTLDAVHLASAKALDDRTRLTAFVAADRNLLNAAAACRLPGLAVG